MTAPILKVPCIRPTGTIVGIGLALVLTACVPAGLPETMLQPQMRYLCRDGAILTVDRAPGGEFATAASGGRQARLMRMDSALQEKYTDGVTTLYLDGTQALLTSDSFVVAGPCMAMQPMPVTQTYRPT